MVAAKVKQIIAAMTASCMSPQEIADKAGVSVNIVYRMRRGYLVKMDRFGRVCRALGVDPEQYIDYSRLEQRKRKINYGW
jgi:DNA-binding Xre family transcriptional regulator|nr:helix-turn-helix transcriptional regulator [uncultured Acetatifactor sp.]